MADSTESSTTFYLATAAVLLGTAYAVWKYFINIQDSWEKHGVKLAKDFSSKDFANFRTAFFKIFDRYGDTVGIQRGSMQLLTRDLNILKQIMVKEFNNFVDRNAFLKTNSFIGKGLFFADEDHWRRLRLVSSPSFSTGKLKLISRDVEKTAKKLSDVLYNWAKEGKLVPIKDTTTHYTSGIIARTAFGLNSDCLGQEDDEFTQCSKALLKQRSTLTRLLITYLNTFPKFLDFLVKTLKIDYFDMITKRSNTYFDSVLRQVIAQRRQTIEQGLKQHKDFLQQMILAKENGIRSKPIKENLNEKEYGQDEISEKAVEHYGKPLTDDEIVGQSILVIFAGFETTATTLQMCLYLLSKHPDIQEKVLDEILEVVGNRVPTHEELGQLKYTEQVINETLRLFPPVALITRKAKNTCKIENITIPKGASILIPIFAILKNPAQWPDPEKFDPDRFTDENKKLRNPLSFMPFGGGPRLCIGMRLAYLELKMALVFVLRRVKFELNDRTEPKKGGDVTLKKQGLTVLEKPIQLEVKVRD